MTTEVCQVVYILNAQGEWNVFTLPVCRRVQSFTYPQVKEALEYFRRKGIAKKIEYI